MNFFAISALINAITSTAAGAVILSKNWKSELNRSFFYFASSVALWSYGYFLWQINTSPKEALFWCRFLMVGAILIPPTLLHFSISLIGQYKKYARGIFLTYVTSILFLFLNFTPLIVQDVRPRLIFPYWPTAGSLYWLFLIVFFGVIIVSHTSMYKSYKKLSGLKRSQIKYVFLGTAIGFGGGSTNYPLWYDVPVLPYGNILVSVYVLLLAYAIIKYRLMDIRLAITKVGIFFLVYALILSIPLWLGYKLHYWKQSVWLMLLLATIGPYIYTYLRKQAENKLLQAQIAYQKTLKQAAYGMGRIKKLDTLVKLIDRILIRSAGIEKCAVYLIDKQEERPIFNLTKNIDSLPERITLSPEVLTALKRFSEPFIIEELVYHNPDNTDVKQMAEFLKPFQTEIIIPIVQSDKLLSLILLGKKKDHSIYTNDDLTVFTILASQAGLAMENCFFLEAEKERLEREGASARRESLDMMVSTMAHEIDNPIQGAIGKAVMIEEVLNFFRSCLPKETLDELKKHSKDMMDNCERVSKIIRAVENYSKRETGTFKKVHINEVMIPTHSLLPLFQKNYKGVQYTEDIEEDLPPIWGEDIMIEEILMNLVENAYHAVIHNKDEMKVHLHILKKNKDSVRIETIDNGYGIAPKIKEQLFEVPTTTKGSSEGTGVGLYRIRQICELLKAKYGAESEGRGKGALFYVEIPIYKETSPHKEEENN